MLEQRILTSIAQLIMSTQDPEDLIDEQRLLTIIHVCCADAKVDYEQPYEQVLKLDRPTQAGDIVAKIALTIADMLAGGTQ